MLRYTIARESPSDVFAPEAGGTYQLGDFDCIADPVTLIAKPRGNYASEYEARLALEPYLQSWSAKAELVDRVPMSFHFVGSELAERQPEPGGGDGIELVVFDAVHSHHSDSVTLIRVVGELPAPDPHWHGESPLARDLRLRARALADDSSLPAVAYAMYDGIKAKYGGPGRAAVSLGVSTGLLEQVSKLSGGAKDRKPTNPITLSDYQRAWLLQAMRALARRVAEVEAGIASLPTSGDDLARFESLVEHWYDEHMSRISGWYKRWTKLVLIIVGAVVAILANVDTIQVSRQLYVNEPVRAAVLSQVNDGNLCQDETDPEQRRTCAKDEMAKLEASGLPLWWSSGTNPDDATDWAVKILGFLLTAFAVSFGAPFWFDALSKLGSLRTAGPKPEGARAETP